jgi:hypothetical protein
VQPGPLSPPCSTRPSLLPDTLRSRPLRALAYVELDRVAVLQVIERFAGDVGAAKEILLTLGENEPEPFVVGHRLDVRVIVSSLAVHGTVSDV